MTVGNTNKMLSAFGDTSPIQIVMYKLLSILIIIPTSLGGLIFHCSGVDINNIYNCTIKDN